MLINPPALNSIFDPCVKLTSTIPSERIIGWQVIDLNSDSGVGSFKMCSLNSSEKSK